MTNDKQHYEALAIYNARLKGRSKWLWKSTTKKDFFVEAWRDGTVEWSESK